MNFSKKVLLGLSIFGVGFFFKINFLACGEGVIEFKFNKDLTAQVTKLTNEGVNDGESTVEIPSKIIKDGICYDVTSFSDDITIDYDNLKEIYLPETFNGSKGNILGIIKLNDACPNLEKINVDPRCKDLSSDSQGIMYNKDQTHLVICPAGKTGAVKIQNSVKSIYVHAFDKCKIQKSIKIPTGVESVGNALCIKNSEIVENKNDSKNENTPKHEKIVIILLGESGAGKTTIAEYLKEYGYFNIPTYTTRQPRFKGEEGHIFIDIDSVDSIIPLDGNSERKLVYITYFANNWYWAYEDQITDNDRSVIAFNPTETKSFKEYVKDRKVIVIYLRTDRKECVDRMKKRALNGDLTDGELKDDIERRVLLEDNEYSSFSCDYVIDATKGIEQTIANLENCLCQEGLK